MSLPLAHIRAWLLHFFTASGAFFGVIAIDQIYQQNDALVFWLFVVTILIDAVDGTLARRWNVGKVLPQIDGALLDNLVDFFTYAIVPCFFFLKSPLLAFPFNYIATLLVLMASAYQFTQSSAKTDDHFFQGFPSYWNITALYLWYWNFSSLSTFLIIATCSALSFIPIKYIYPSQLDNISQHRLVKQGVFILTLAWGACTIAMIAFIPERIEILKVIVLAYIAFYFFFSLYRTVKPIS